MPLQEERAGDRGLIDPPGTADDDFNLAVETR